MTPTKLFNPKGICPIIHVKKADLVKTCLTEVRFGTKVNMILFDRTNFIEHLFFFSASHEGARLPKSIRYGRELFGLAWLLAYGKARKIGRSKDSF